MDDGRPDLRLVDKQRCGATNPAAPDDGLSCYLAAGHDGDHLMDETPLAAEPPTRDEMLEAVPLDIEIDDAVNLEAEDPALVEASGRRLCISTRRAGGRCTAPPLRTGLLCAVHAGALDPSAGGHARAAKLRDSRETQQERDRVGSLGTRAAIADQLAGDIVLVRAALHNLARLASQGDRQAALALIPFLNQGLGQPTERVMVEEASTPLSDRSTAELAQIVQARRVRRQAESA